MGLNLAIASDTLLTILEADALLTPLKSPTTIRKDPVAKYRNVSSNLLMGDTAKLLKDFFLYFISSVQ